VLRGIEIGHTNGQHLVHNNAVYWLQTCDDRTNSLSIEATLRHGWRRAGHLIDELRCIHFGRQRCERAQSVFPGPSQNDSLLFRG